MPATDLSNVNLNLLVALEALLRTGSVSRAATRVHVTTSAMSHSLAALRRLFDDPLLVRTGRGMGLTPLAQSLVTPLSSLLRSAERLFDGGGDFDPARADRRFVLAAPDFLATMLLPPLWARVAREAPGVRLEVVPTHRRANAWLLETGEIDLALGAVVDDAAGILRMDLCTEGFLCAVRAGHPALRRATALDLDAYARIPHLMITLGDDDRPTWIDEELARLGRSRQVGLRVRYFMSAPLVVANTDLLMTGPAMLLRYFAGLVPLRLFAPPIALPTYPEEMYWHQRFDHDPAHRWLRERLREICADLGTGTAPERRRWNASGATGKPRGRRTRTRARAR